MLFSMNVRPVTSRLTLFLLQYPCQPYFLLKMPGVGVEKGGCRLGKKKDFSHIHIFQTNIHMYKNKHAL